MFSCIHALIRYIADDELVMYGTIYIYICIRIVYTYDTYYLMIYIDCMNGITNDEVCISSTMYDVYLK